MCKHLTMLAKENVRRYIAQCEHGTIHLMWDNLSLRLRPADFLDIVERIQTNEDWLGQEKAKGFGFVLRGIELKILPETLTTMRNLMVLAVLQMNTPSGLDFRPKMTGSDASTFSPN